MTLSVIADREAHHTPHGWKEKQRLHRVLMLIDRFSPLALDFRLLFNIDAKSSCSARIQPQLLNIAS